MPAVGDQHKSDGPGTANPFADSKPQTTQYTATEIATLQARLDKQLGPEFISSRPGASGQKVHYLAGEKVINLANEVLGFNGWSSAIQNIQIDFVDEHAQTGKISLGLSVIVRVTLKDGTYHEDVGYGHIENCKGKAAAFAKAKKEGTTDALKRALRTFGKVLGNCVYDKDFLGRVTKMKVGKGKWDENDLHRHSDFAPIKKEEVNGSGEEKIGANATLPRTTESEMDMDEGFDIADFDDAEFGVEEFGDPDQIVLPEATTTNDRRGSGTHRPLMGPPMSNRTTTPSRPSNGRPTPAPTAASRGMPPSPQTNIQPQYRMSGPPGGPDAAQASRLQLNPPQLAEQLNSSTDNNHTSSPGVPSQHFAPANNNPSNLYQSNTGPARPATFYSARAATIIDADNNLLSAPPNAVPKFNPHAESPSIRKTVGVDHRKSAPLPKSILAKDPVPAGGPPVPSRDFIDPRSDQARRLGIPAPSAGAMSPGGRTAPGGIGGSGAIGTSAYRPPSRRAMDPSPVISAQGFAGGVDRVLAAAKRPPLGDLSNIQQNLTTVTGDGGDAKRTRMSGPNVQPLAGHGQGQGPGNRTENTSAGAPG